MIEPREMPVSALSMSPTPCVGSARETERRGAVQRSADRRDQPGDRHVRGQAQHHQRQQCPQIAAAGAREIAARAAAGEHHADAEHEAAGDVPEPAERRRQIHRLVESDDAGTLQKLRTDQCRGCGQHPGPEAAVVAEVVDVGQGAHGAVVGAVDDGAEHEADQQAAERQGERVRCRQ